MILSDMVTLLNRYVDDVVDVPSATTLFNAGQNKMAISIDAAFPQLDSTNLNGTFVFPVKYHELPVLYAAAMVKATDSSVNEKNSFLQQFNIGVADFTDNWDVPAQYRDNQYTQQFTAVDGQTAFVIVSDTYVNPYSNLKVYVNSKLASFTLPDLSGVSSVINTTTTYSNDPNSFSLVTACVAGDAVTATWEVHEEFTQPPFTWWGSW